MAKKSLIEAEKRKRSLCIMYADKRTELKNEILKGRRGETPDFVRIARLRKKIPRNAFPARIRNRCLLTGRPRAFIRYFGMCRHKFRSLALAGFLPGVRKSGV